MPRVQQVRQGPNTQLFLRQFSAHVAPPSVGDVPRLSGADEALLKLDAATHTMHLLSVVADSTDCLRYCVRQCPGTPYNT